MCTQIQEQYEMDEKIREQKRKELIEKSQKEVVTKLEEKIKSRLELKKEEMRKKTLEMIEKQKDLAAIQIRSVSPQNGCIEKFGQNFIEHFTIQQKKLRNLPKSVSKNYKPQ